LIRDDFKLDYTQAGWVVSAYTLAYGLSQLPAGWMADRVGARLLITIGISGVALTGLLVGLSPTYTIMVVFLVVMGIIGGGYHPSASPLVSETVDEKNRGRALGLHQIGGTASFFLSPLIAVGIATKFHTWHASFILLSILTFIFGIAFFLLLQRRKVGDKVEARSLAQQNKAAAPSNYLGGLVPFVILGAFLQVVTFSAISFIPLFAVDYLKTSEAGGAALYTVAQFAGLWGGPLGGYLSDRYGKVPVMLVLAFAAGPAIFLLSITSLGWPVYALLLVMGACQYGGMPISESYVISHSPARHRSTILGFYYFASRGGPGLLTPVMGFLIDHNSFGAAFSVVGVATLAVTAVCALLLWRNHNQAARSQIPA
jgi:MFS family permease